MLVPRSYYLSSDYSPSEASYYSYGGVIPNPKYTLQRRLATLRNLPQEANVSSENFQKFLLMQQNPEALGLSKMKLPTTKFGNMTNFLGYGTPDDLSSDQ
ncbi:MAG: hypothetical protein EBS53_15060 [Bacteroidetes bacterium]|nr:hypothetical protein [Bacteroidota bacterium]